MLSRKLLVGCLRATDAHDRVVDQHGVVLEKIMQFKRKKRAAKRLLVRLIKRHGLSKRMVSDKLRSYGAAKRKIAPNLDHWSHKRRNSRTENSHLAFGERERTMREFRSTGGLQRFESVHSAIRNCFSVPSRRASALTIRYHRMEAFGGWTAAVEAA
ncbi:MAG: DDE-type integrase/transposase/recombinase [Roseobacter sp.]